MKANELMIGDWVQHASDNYFKVTRIDMWGDGSTHFACGHPHLWDYNNKFSPIPLTAEILEKNGFVCVQKAYENEQEYECWQFRQGCVQIDYEPQVTMFEVHNGGECNCGVRTINYYTDEDIIYIHQLQHALRLAGIDKTIEL